MASYMYSSQICSYSEAFRVQYWKRHYCLTEGVGVEGKWLTFFMSWWHLVYGNTAAEFLPHTPGRLVCPPHDLRRQSSRWGHCTQTHSWREKETGDMGKKGERKKKTFNPTLLIFHMCRYLFLTLSFNSKLIERQWVIQLIDPIWSHDVREGGWVRRWWRRGAASLAMVMMMMASAPPQSHDVLEADVRLCGVVHTVWDGHHGNRGERGAAGPVTAAH